MNSVVRFGFVSGNAKVTNSIIDKKSSIMEDATIEDSTIYDSVVGCSSKVMNCLLKKGNCINLYEKSCMIGVYLENSSISGNYIINEGRFVDARRNHHAEIDAERFPGKGGVIWDTVLTQSPITATPARLC